MIQAPGRSAASSMVFTAVSLRIFRGIATEYYAAYNAAWICPLVGIILFLPLGFTLFHAGKLRNDSPWNNLTKQCPALLQAAGTVIFCFLLIYDCSLNLRLTAATANFVSLNNISVTLLTLPLAVVLFTVVMLGADAEGNSARIWLLLVPILLGIAAIVQFDKYEPAWLLPILGGGLSSIAQGGLLCGGWISVMCLPWLIAVPDRKKNNPVRPAVLAALFSSALLAALQMLCPAMVETHLSQLARTEIILSNNRVSHTLQMFLTLLWFGSLLHLISIEAVTAACFIQNQLPKLPKWTIALFCSLVPFAFSLTDLMRDSLSSKTYPLLYIVVGSVCALMMGISIAGNGVKNHAKN